MTKVIRISMIMITMMNIILETNMPYTMVMKVDMTPMKIMVTKMIMVVMRPVEDNTNKTMDKLNTMKEIVVTMVIMKVMMTDLTMITSIVMVIRAITSMLPILMTSLLKLKVVLMMKLLLVQITIVLVLNPMMVGRPMTKEITIIIMMTNIIGKLIL